MDITSPFPSFHNQFFCGTTFGFGQPTIFRMFVLCRRVLRIEIRILYFSIENWELRYVYYTQLRYPQFPWTMSHIPIKLTDPRQLFLSFQSKKQIPQDPLLCHQPHQTSFDISFETSKNLDRYFYQLQQLKPLGYTYHESSLTNSI